MNRIVTLYICSGNSRRIQFDTKQSLTNSFDDPCWQATWRGYLPLPSIWDSKIGNRLASCISKCVSVPSSIASWMMQLVLNWLEISSKVNEVGSFSPFKVKSTLQAWRFIVVSWSPNVSQSASMFDMQLLATIVDFDSEVCWHAWRIAASFFSVDDTVSQ